MVIVNPPKKPFRVERLRNGAIRKVYEEGPDRDALSKAVSKHTSRVQNFSTPKKGKKAFIKFVQGGFSGKK